MSDLPAEVQSWICQKRYEQQGEFDVERGYIFTTCSSVQNGNPIFWDEKAAEEITGGVVAPPLRYAASDGMVTRALERAGLRARNAAGRRNGGGPQAVDCDEDVPLHVCLDDVTSFCSLEELLAGAWIKVPEVAHRLGVEPAALSATLDAYCRSLLAAGVPHDYERLRAVLLDGARR